MQAFPWPAGKAPWLKENGGTGVVPDGALEKLELSRCRTFDGRLCIVAAIVVANVHNHMQVS